MQLEEDVEGALDDGPVHGRGGHHGRRHERRVGHRLAVGQRHVADDGTESEAQAEQIEERLEGARDDDHPDALVDEDVAFDQVARTEARQGQEQELPGRDGRGRAHLVPIT